MENVIQQILLDIESIKLSLEVLANKGIDIKDTFAPITFTTTIGATIIGGLIALWGTKIQEKGRIKNEMRLDRYNQFQNIYNDIYVNINNFVGHMEIIKSTYPDISEWNIYFEQNKLWNLRIMRSLICPLKEIKHLRLRSNEIHKFIENNKRVLGIEDNPYDGIIEEINKIYSLFSNVEILDSLIDTTVYDSFINENISDYNKKIKGIINSDEKVKAIYIDMEGFRVMLEDKTISEYFK